MQHDGQRGGHQIHHRVVGPRQPALASPRADDQRADRFAVVAQRPGLRRRRLLATLHDAAVSPFDGDVLKPERIAQRIDDAGEVITGQPPSDCRHRGYRVAPRAVHGAVDQPLQARPGRG